MLKSIYKNSEKGWATARVAPTEKRERAGQNPAPTEGYMGCGKRADVGIGPYGSATRSAVNGPSGTPAPTKAQQELR